MGLFCHSDLSPHLIIAYKAFSAGSTINNVDSTPNAVACCEFRQQLFLFWKANDSSNSIYFSQSFDGQRWVPGEAITTSDSTSAALACCVFNEQIFVFWKANDSSNAIYFSSSPTGADKSWSGGQKINGIDSTPESLAACVFENQIYLFWKADDSSNAIYFSSSATGQANSWSPGQKINATDHTPQAPAACVYCNQIYLFWEADDPSNSIYFSTYNDKKNVSTWPLGKNINSVDHTPMSLSSTLYISN